MSIYKQIVFLVVLLLGCQKEEQGQNLSSFTSFGEPQQVTINGYDGVIMEPFITRDDSKLFFNNSNSPAVNTELHWATKINDSTFEYQGLLNNVNTDALEGVATMDENNNFYFVSTRSYEQDLSTIYQGVYQSGSVNSVSLVEGISKLEPGAVNFDVEVSADGRFLCMVDGTYDSNGGPYTASFVLVERKGTTFSRSDQSDELLKNINTNDLEYAAGISSGGLELYFTRIKAPINSNSLARIYYSKRKSTEVFFPFPTLLDKIDGFVEGPTVSGDGQRIYYHKKVGDTFQLFMVRKL